ncbi:hypothetical protein HZP42_19085 [Elizabethkingia anophelis]|nr:hypothetical protein [Elizabethkingia anophelis]
MSELHNKLKDAIDNYNKTKNNQKILEDYFGAENLKNLPFRHLKVLLSYSDRDGDEYLEIDFNTFKTDHYCMVAGMGEPLLTDNMVKAIEKELFKILNI